MTDIIDAFRAGFSWAYSENKDAQEFPCGDLRYSWENRAGVWEHYEFPLDETVFSVGRDLNSFGWDAGRSIGNQLRHLASRLTNG